MVCPVSAPIPPRVCFGSNSVIIRTFTHPRGCCIHPPITGWLSGWRDWLPASRHWQRWDVCGMRRVSLIVQCLAIITWLICSNTHTHTHKISHTSPVRDVSILRVHFLDLYSASAIPVMYAIPCYTARRWVFFYTTGMCVVCTVWVLVVFRTLECVW